MKSITFLRNSGRGYVPTPTKLVDDMMLEAQIMPGMQCLEPSAGDGRIAVAIREINCAVTVCEVNWNAKKLLKILGFTPIVDNFLEYTPGEVFDRVVMNPPFDNCRDIKHIVHAYECLRPDGRIVAIMGEHAFFASDEQSRLFRIWYDENNAHSYKLSLDAFKDSGIDKLHTRMVVIDKPK